MSTLRRGDQIKPYPYFIIKPLGIDEGNMSEVYLAQTLTAALAPRANPLRRQQSTAMFEQKVVVKIARVKEATGAALTPDDSYFNTDALRKEESRLRRLNHPAIVQLLPVRDIHNRSIGTLARSQLEHEPWFAVLEYLAGPSLLAYLERLQTQHAGHPRGLDLNLALGITYILAGALDYLHHTGKPWLDTDGSEATVHVGVAHLDIKPANILFRREPLPGHRPEPVLVDFGITGDIGRSTLEAGTLAYMAPERVLGNIPYPTAQMDIYSLGVVLYEMVTGVNPFHCPDELATRAAIIAGYPPKPSSLPHMQHLSLLPRLDKLILRMLDRNPEKRPELEIVSQETKALLIEGGQPTLWPEEPDAERVVSKSPGGRRWLPVGWKLLQSALLLGLGAMLMYMFFALNPRVNNSQSSLTLIADSITLAPTVTPLPAPTATATATPAPTPTITSEPSPTATLTPSPTATSTVTETPTEINRSLNWCPSSSPLRVRLIDPVDGSGTGVQVFRWELLEGTLPQDQAYEVIFYPCSSDPMSEAGFGLEQPLQAEQLRVDLRIVDGDSRNPLIEGDYCWGVRLVSLTIPDCQIKMVNDNIGKFNYKN